MNRKLEQGNLKLTVRMSSDLYAAGKLVCSWALLIGSEALFCLFGFLIFSALNMLPRDLVYYPVCGLGGGTFTMEEPQTAACVQLWLHNPATHSIP